MSAPPPDTLCIGAAHWDVIAHADAAAMRGDDLPGRVRMAPGGVALNLACALAAEGRHPALLAAIGRDAAGRALARRLRTLGVRDAMLRVAAAPTGAYVAIEDGGGLVAAVAATGPLDAAGTELLAPLADGRLASADRPWTGAVVVDGNLAPAALAALAAHPGLAGAPLAVAGASPAKAPALRALLGREGVAFYLNRAEAEALCDAPARSTAEACATLLAAGAACAVVTDAARPAAAATRTPHVIVTAMPPRVVASRITGAGDAFMAAHLAALWRGTPAAGALTHALACAATHITEGPPA